VLVVALLLAASVPHSTAPARRWVDDVVSTLGPFHVEAGAWAEYLVQSRGEQDVRVRFAIVDPPPDRTRVWVEVAIAGSRAVPFAVRLLLNAATGKLERASLYALGQAPIEIPMADGEAGEVVARPARILARRTKIVTVPAGTFGATEVLVRHGADAARVWRAEEVPLWGIVRARQAGRTIELLRFGHGGARSVLPAQGNGSDRAKE
jgi:hypothetical protein